MQQQPVPPKAPPIAPKEVLEPDLTTLTPVWNYSACSEAELAQVGVRVTFLVELGKATPITSLDSRSARMESSVLKHLQNIRRSNGAASFYLECICKPDLQGNLIAMKYTAGNFSSYRRSRPVHIPKLRLPNTHGRRRIQKPQLGLFPATKGLVHPVPLFGHLVRIQCLITIRKPRNATINAETSFSIVDGIVNGQSIDVSKKVEGLQDYIPALLKYAELNKYWPIIAQMDCSAIQGQNRCFVQRWAFPEEIEAMATRIRLASTLSSNAR